MVEQKEPRIIFLPNKGDLSHSARTLLPGKSRAEKACQTLSSSKSFEQDGCLSVLALIATDPLHHEESRLIHGPLSLPF